MKVGPDMPGWGTKRSHPGAASSRAVGAVRIPGESDPLKVEITITEVEVTMRSAELDLGSWPYEDVRITRIDPFSFAFVAEGDRLVFVPDDARGFAAHPLVGAPNVSDRPSGKWRLKGQLRFRSAKPKATPKRKSQAKPRSDIPRSSTPKAKRPSPKFARRIPVVGAKRKPAVADDSRAPADSDRTGMWIRAIDSARENGWFGLDRVPVHLNQRHQEHQHTYDHGAAAPTGLGKHVCTICGKVRLRT